jgi:hypothetical protein
MKKSPLAADSDGSALEPAIAAYAAAVMVMRIIGERTVTLMLPRRSSVIPKSEYRFSDKITLKNKGLEPGSDSNSIGTDKALSGSCS